MEVEVQWVSVSCNARCLYGSLEVKFEKDFRISGVRLCCSEHVQRLGTVLSRTHLVVLSAYSTYHKHTFSVRYRIGGIAPDRAG